eukprot:161545_1
MTPGADDPMLFAGLMASLKHAPEYIEREQKVQNAENYLKSIGAYCYARFGVNATILMINELHKSHFIQSHPDRALRELLVFFDRFINCEIHRYLFYCTLR